MSPLAFFDAVQQFIEWCLMRDCCAAAEDSTHVTAIGDEMLAVTCAACGATWACETKSAIHIIFDDILGSTWTGLSKKKKAKYKPCPRCGSKEEICPC